LAAILQGYRVLYREAHTLINELADAALDGTRKQQMERFVMVPLLIIDDLGMRKLPPTAVTLGGDEESGDDMELDWGTGGASADGAELSSGLGMTSDLHSAEGARIPA
jgi:hypothetical protein